MRFTGKRQCTPAIWLDGQEVRDMELDNIPVTDIEGMELYSGPVDDTDAVLARLVAHRLRRDRHLDANSRHA